MVFLVDSLKLRRVCLLFVLLPLKAQRIRSKPIETSSCFAEFNLFGTARDVFLRLTVGLSKHARSVVKLKI